VLLRPPRLGDLDDGYHVIGGEALKPGRSGTVPMPRDPADVVTELHDVLAAADVPGPYALVGHSIGGAFNVLYAHTFPDEVRALVIVDSPLPPLRDKLTPEQWALGKSMSSDPALVPNYELEAYDLGVLFDEIAAAPPLPEIPVVVVRRGEIKMSDDPLPDNMPLIADEMNAMNAAQRESQSAFAASIPGAKVVTVPGTTHYVQTQRPDAVLEAIRTAISETR
jgi:pimeloyl-ACP methyl ester carboxylesterase